MYTTWTSGSVSFVRCHGACFRSLLDRVCTGRGQPRAAAGPSVLGQREDLQSNDAKESVALPWSVQPMLWWKRRMPGTLPGLEGVTSLSR